MISHDPGRTRLAEIQEQLCQDVTTKARKELENHATNMEVESTDTAAIPNTMEARFIALEVGVTELKHQNAQFMSWFQETGERMQVTEQAVGELQQSMQQQQQDLSQLGSNFNHSVQTLKHDLSAEISNSFQAQMTQLTALLEKRPRQEY